MQIIPLPDWYPSMYDLWRREGRRLSVPIGDRVGYTVHQTAGGDRSSPVGYARGVADYHYHTKGWSRPGGYNFLIGTDGVIRAMCGWGFVGAHAPGCNYNRIGVAFQGTFATKLPNSKQLRAFSDLVGQNRVPNNQTGHRDCSSTTCPGAELYRALPLNVQTPKEEDEVAKSGLTRISNSDEVYDFAGFALLRVKSRHQAGVIVQHRTNEPGAASDIVSENRWQQHVGNVSRGEANHFQIVDNFGPGEAFTWTEADDRYARKDHQHKASVTLA